MQTFAFDQETSQLLEKIAGFLSEVRPVFLVGGAVRDLMLGKPVHDLDFTVARDVFPLARILSSQLNGAYYPMDDEHGTARIILENTDGEQFFLDFNQVRGNSILDDLSSRDFTINAIALDIFAPDSVYDPFNGLQDLRDRILRLCSEDSIQNDPVRLIRAIRMAVQYNLRIPVETSIQLARGTGFLEKVSIERIRDEFFKILDGEHPSTGLRLLDHYECLSQIVPEMETLKGVDQSSPHIMDVWNHTLEVVQRVSELLEWVQNPHSTSVKVNLFTGVLNLKVGRFRQSILAHMEQYLSRGRSRRSLLIFSALLHDIGKPPTRKVEEDGKTRFFQHDDIGSEIAGKRSRSLRLSNYEIDYVGLIVREHMRPLLLANEPGPPTSRAIYRYFRNLGSIGIDICLLALGDTLATYGSTLPIERWEAVVETVRLLMSAWWETPQKNVEPAVLLTGRDLIKEFNLKPGPLIGRLLEEIKIAQVETTITNKSEAFDLVRSILNSEGTG